MPTTDHDPIDFTFADDGDLVRRAPDTNGAPERDMSFNAARHKRSRSKVANRVVTEAERAANVPTAIEIRHGSGKVKV